MNRAAAEPPLRRAAEIAQRLRVGVFCVARGDLASAGAVLRAVPAELRDLLATACVLADAALLDAARGELAGLAVLALADRPGYGALQKAAVAHALRTGLDVLVVLPSGAPRAADALAALLAPLADDGVAAVVGSRLLPGAPRAAMPLLRRMGNRIVSGVQARLLGSAITDFHSGCRAYRTAALARLPIRHNGEGPEFDTEVLIQLQWRGERVVEVPIPAHSGGRLRGFAAVRAAVQAIGSVLRARANRVYLVHHPKFDLDTSDEYVFKEAPTSVHQAVLRRGFEPGSAVLELGAGHGRVASALHRAGLRVVAVDHRRPAARFDFPYLEHDLDRGFAAPAREVLGGAADYVIALDVIEHLLHPEEGLAEVRRALGPGGRLLASTGNVAFWPVRLMLLLGQFNYGRKGILDRTHTRLFTVRSFCRTIEGEGFRVRSVRGFGPPIEDMVGRSAPLRALDRAAAVLARIWPGLFAYQILVEADVGPPVVALPASGSAPA